MPGVAQVLETLALKAQDKWLGVSAACSANKQSWQGEQRSSFLPSCGSRANKKMVVEILSLLTCYALPGLLRRVGLDRCQPLKAAGSMA